MEKRKRVFSFFNDFIPYYRQLPKITGSVTSAILAAKLETQFEKQPDGFYKFLEPAPNHIKYKVGHSWTETLGFSREEFLEAFSRIGVNYKSKTDYMNTEKKFSITFEVPKYKVKQNKNGTFNGKFKTIDEKEEKEMYYCRYHDRQTGLTYYLKNKNRSLIKDALSVNPKVRKYRKSEVTEMQKSEDTEIQNSEPSEIQNSEPSEIQNSEPSEIQNSEGSELLYNKVSVDTSVDTSVEGAVDVAPKTPPPISPSPANEDQKQIPTRHTSEWDMWKVERGEPIYEKCFERRPFYNGKDMDAFCRLRGAGATVTQITKCYEEFCGTQNSYYAKRGYAFHVFAEDFNAFGNEKMKSIIAKTEHGAGKKNGLPNPNVVIEDLGELTLKRFGLA